MAHLVLLFSFILSCETVALAQGPEKKPAVFEVLLPADATLEVDGHPTQSTGERRRFQSPPVETGSTYAYPIKATWRGHTLTRTIRLRAERVTTVDLRQELQAMPPPTPAGSFSLLVPPAMMLEAGEAALLPLRVKRFHFPAAIQITFEKLPQGVRIGAVTLAEDQTDIRAPVSVAADAPRGTREINVTARSGSTTDAATTKITVRRPEAEAVNKAAVKPVPLPETHPETKPASKPERKAETPPPNQAGGSPRRSEASTRAAGYGGVGAGADEIRGGPGKDSGRLRAAWRANGVPGDDPGPSAAFGAVDAVPFQTSVVRLHERFRYLRPAGCSSRRT
jgi:uncharacterized protein (TIGR03000 family)